MASKVVVLIGCVVISAAYGLQNIQLPEGCENKAFCDVKPVAYPDSFFNDHHLRNKEKLMIRNKRYQGESLVREYKSDGNNCGTRVTIIKPFIVRSNTTMKLVVQSNIFEQWVKQTECINNGPCFQDVLTPSLSSSCTQTDGTIKLYLYDPKTKRFEHEAITFPVCCSCSIKSKI